MNFIHRRKDLKNILLFIKKSYAAHTDFELHKEISSIKVCSAIIYIFHFLLSLNVQISTRPSLSVGLSYQNFHHLHKINFWLLSTHWLRILWFPICMLIASKLLWNYPHPVSIWLVTIWEFMKIIMKLWKSRVKTLKILAFWREIIQRPELVCHHQL